MFCYLLQYIIIINLNIYIGGMQFKIEKATIKKFPYSTLALLIERRRFQDESMCSNIIYILSFYFCLLGYLLIVIQLSSILINFMRGSSRPQDIHPSIISSLEMRGTST